MQIRYKKHFGAQGFKDVCMCRERGVGFRKTSEYCKWNTITNEYLENQCALKGINPKIKGVIFDFYKFLAQ